MIIKQHNLTYENVEFRQSSIPRRALGSRIAGDVFLATRPQTIGCMVVINGEPPTILLNIAMSSRLIDYVEFEIEDIGSEVYGDVVIESAQWSEERTTLRMIALRHQILLSEKARKRFEIMELINNGQLIIGVKN